MAKWVCIVIADTQKEQVVLGIEPRERESESRMLPLHHTTI